MKNKHDLELIAEAYSKVIGEQIHQNLDDPIRIAYVEFGTRGDGDTVHKLFTNKQVQNIVDSNIDDRTAAVQEIANMYDGSIGDVEHSSYSDKIKVGNIAVGETTALLVIFSDSPYYKKTKDQLEASLRNLDASL